MSSKTHEPADAGSDLTAARLDELRSTLRTTEGSAWVAASMSVADMGPDASDAIVELSHGLLNGGGRLVHWAAAYALGRVGPGASGALEALEHALADASADVRVEAREAIRRITGEDPLSGV